MVRLKHWRARIILIAVIACAVAGAPDARRAAEKKPITHDVYDSWRSIQGTQLSRDGTWLVYALVPQDGDGELVARNLKTNAEYRHPRGRMPLSITADGTAVVFTIAPPKADVDKAKKDKKKPEDLPKSGMGIMTLATGQVAAVDRVKSFKIAEDASASVAYLMEPPKAPKSVDKDGKEPEAEGASGVARPKKEKKKDPGADLVVRNLGTGATTTLPDVTE